MTLLYLYLFISIGLLLLLFNISKERFEQKPNDNIDIYLISIHPKTHIKVRSAIENINKAFNRKVNIILVEGVIVEKDTLESMDTSLSRGQVGCAMAHANVWDTIIKNRSSGWSFIFEDDVIFLDNNPIGSVDELIAQFPDDADAINLGGCSGFMNNCPPGQNWHRGWASCLHAYCLTLTGAKLAKQNHIENNFFTTVDTSLRRCKKFRTKSNAYILKLPKRLRSSEERRLAACKSGYFCQRRDGDFKSDIRSL
jgi:hypothetical protein